MPDHSELLRKHTQLEREIREAEIRVAKSTSGPEKLQALNELDELHVRIGEIKWQLASKFGSS